MRASAWGQALAESLNVRTPCVSMWTAAVEDSNFWNRQFEELALIILAKARVVADVARCETRVETRASGASPVSIVVPENRTLQERGTMQRTS